MKSTRILPPHRLAQCFLILFFFCVCVDASPYSPDIYKKFRARNYKQITTLYKKRIPETRLDRFVLASSHEKLLSLAVSDFSVSRRLPARLRGIFRMYLRVLNIHCPDSKTEIEFQKCLQDYEEDSAFQKSASRQNHLDKLALVRAHSLARKYKLKSLAYKLLQAGDLSNNDPLTREVFIKQIATERNAGRSTNALKLAKQHTHLQSPDLNRERARAFYRSGQRQKALGLYFKAVQKSKSYYFKRSLLKELRRNYAGLFKADSLSKRAAENRSLLHFSRILNRQELRSLAKAFPPYIVLKSSTEESARTDGYFFLRSLQAVHLPALADKYQDELLENPELIYRWMLQLSWDRNRPILGKMLRKFANVRFKHRGIWRIYVAHLEKHSSRKAYFEELVAFLKVNHSDYRMHDQLIEFLIGKDINTRRWAHSTYWLIALKELPPLTTKGRFIFWLKQYYLARGNKSKAVSLERSFYQNAPGSYYAHAFWKGNKKGNYYNDWEKVRDRAGFLLWVSAHGGNDQALRYLAGRDIRSYLDPSAVALWSRLQNAKHNIPESIMDMYRLGEYSYAGKFYTEVFGDNVPRVQSLAHKSYIGRKTRNLYLSVYYTRQLARHLNIAEDPFSMPEGLLKELYPRPYLKAVNKYSNTYGIRGEAVYALMRQESMYREVAISRSGARGLMQVMPKTGAWLAGKMGIKEYNLLNPDTSIKMGTKFFADLLRSNDKDFRWASIAYNGGPGNLRKWKRQYYKGDLNKFLEFLPNHESRNYCRITFQNYEHYRITYLLYE